MRKILALSVVALLASATLAEAGPCGRRGLFGRRAAAAAAPCGQAGFSHFQSYSYSQTTYSSCYSAPVPTSSCYSASVPTTSHYSVPAPVVKATPQSAPPAPSKTLPY